MKLSRNFFFFLGQSRARVLCYMLHTVHVPLFVFLIGSLYCLVSGFLCVCFHNIKIYSIFLWITFNFKQSSSTLSLFLHRFLPEQERKWNTKISLRMPQFWRLLHKKTLLQQPLQAWDNGLHLQHRRGVQCLLLQPFQVQAKQARFTHRFNFFSIIYTCLLAYKKLTVIFFLFLHRSTKDFIDRTCSCGKIFVIVIGWERYIYHTSET